MPTLHSRVQSSFQTAISVDHAGADLFVRRLRLFFDGCLSDVIRAIQSGAGSCAAISSSIPDTLFQNVCQALCDSVGVPVFATLVLSNDAYPIALCAAMRECAPNTCTQGCGLVTNFSVLPSVALPGQPILIAFSFVAKRKIGAGEIYTQVVGPSDLLVMVQHTLVPSDDKWSNFSVTVPTSAFQTGVYSGNVSVCAGDCLDAKHGVIMGNRTFTFTLV